MKGQGIIGQDCEWCANPAVERVLISPSTLRDDRRGARLQVHAEQWAWVCDDHLHLKLDPEKPPLTVRNFRRRKAEGYEQTDIFGAMGGEAA